MHHQFLFTIKQTKRLVPASMDANRVVPAEGRRSSLAKAGSDASVRQHNRVYYCTHGHETHAYAKIPLAYIHKYISCIINFKTNKRHHHHHAHARHLARTRTNT
jgi:hypothetical protein